MNRPLTPPKRPLREAIQSARFHLRAIEAELKKPADECDTAKMKAEAERLHDAIVSSTGLGYDVKTLTREYAQTIDTWYPRDSNAS